MKNENNHNVYETVYAKYKSVDHPIFGDFISFTPESWENYKLGTGIKFKIYVNEKELKCGRWVIEATLRENGVYTKTVDKDVIEEWKEKYSFDLVDI